MALTIQLAEDGTAATLEMRHRGEPLGHMVLDAAGLDHLIGVLAGVRARMRPQVSLEIAPDTPLNAVVDPSWRTRHLFHPAVAGPLLALRHPGLGWVPFVLPIKEAQSLGQWLVEHVQAREPASPVQTPTQAEAEAPSSTPSPKAQTEAGR